MSLSDQENALGLAPDRWLEIRPEGLYVRPADVFIDPQRPVPRAVVSHGHADHARPGHGTVWATAATLAIMGTRYGAAAVGRAAALGYGEVARLGDARLWLAPAGHVLGSAQVVIEHGGTRVVYSGDYKRRADPTTEAFAPVPCDVFITEATFGLPVFRQPPTAGEIDKLMASLATFPERCHVIGAYALGKAQRLIGELRAAGYDRPIHLHGALLPLCRLYEAHGVRLGPLEAATVGEKGRPRADLAGQIVVAPPAAIADRWARRLPDALPAMASGWMQVRQRARQRGVELPLVISDHADWDELLATVLEVGAGEVWITHGREEALAHALEGLGIKARPLALIGFDEEDQ
jgi:putative mRNA 3-end processing factor